MDELNTHIIKWSKLYLDNFNQVGLFLKEKKDSIFLGYI